MNNKGFTLIELVACVVVLSCIALVTTTSITSSMKKSKQDLYDTQLGLIRDAAVNYVSENMKLVPKLDSTKTSDTYYISLSDLTESGLIDKKINNPITNEIFKEEDLCIKLLLNYNATYDKTLFNYDISDNKSDCNGLKHFGN